MAGPKIAVIGAGSFFFGRPVIWNMAHSEVLRDGTLALVDTDPARLETMMNLAKKTFEAAGVPAKVVGSTNRREVLKDADFVVLTFSERNAHYRGIDTEITAKYGVRMCSSDTIGPGGIFRSLREIPRALAMCKDVEELAPHAWVINFVNPTSVLGIALMRYANVRSFAICDGLHEPYRSLSLAKQAGLLEEDATVIPPTMLAKLDMAVMGVNHFTWLTRFKYDGKDMLPACYEKRLKDVEFERENTEASLARDTDINNNANAKGRFNFSYTKILWDAFGVMPLCMAHTKEYVPFFQGYGKLANDPEPIQLFDAADRAKKMDERWAETEKFARGELPIQQFIDEGKADHATDIIEGMWGNLGKQFYINTANCGAVSNMADDAFLELRCHVSMDGPVPQPVGAMPRGLLGLQQQVLDTHELTAEAAVTCDRDILYRAMATDPIINNLEDAQAIMNELLKAEADALPEAWAAGKKLVMV